MLRLTRTRFPVKRFHCICTCSHLSLRKGQSHAGEMELCLVLAMGSLLLIQASHPMLLEGTTDSPGRTMDKKWWRKGSNNTIGRQNQSVEEPTARDQELDSGGTSTGDDMSGLPLASTFHSSGEYEENQEGNINGTYDDMAIVTIPILPTTNADTEAVSSAPAAPKTEAATQLNPNLSMNNGSNAEGEFQDSTVVPSKYTDQMTLNSSTSPKSSNTTELEEATLDPETHDTNGSSGGTDLENRQNPNNTEETTSGKPNVSNTTAPEDSAAPSTPLPPTAAATTESPLPETTVDEAVPVTMTTVIPGTTENTNITDKDKASGGSNTERGLASGSNKNKRNEAWATILGTAVAVCVIALVIYAILKKKNQKDFSHRKLVEFSPDPVLRLDNSEPLDLNYGRGAYYNPALQMDNFQMTSMPARYN